MESFRDLFNFSKPRRLWKTQASGISVEMGSGKISRTERKSVQKRIESARSRLLDAPPLENFPPNDNLPPDFQNSPVDRTPPDNTDSGSIRLAVQEEVKII